MNDSVKKVAIPTLGVMMIAGWILGIDPTTLKIVFGIPVYYSIDDLGKEGLCY